MTGTAVDIREVTPKRSPRQGYERAHYLVLGVVAIGVLAASQALTSNSALNLLNLWIAYSIAALGFYWIFCCAGRFAFCQTFMMALGGYTTAFLAAKDWPFWSCVVGAIAVTAAAGFVVGALLWRAEHLYFALGTLGVTEIGLVVFGRTSAFTGINGNITGVRYPKVFGVQLRTDSEVFWLFAAALAVILLLTIWATRSPLRRDFAAIRHFPPVARTLGVPVERLRITAMIVGSGLGGLSGSLVTHWQGFIGVDSFGLELSIGLFLMVILGGVTSHWGALIGAAFYVCVPELLSGIQQYMSIVYGLLLLVLILVFPTGITGLSVRLGRRQKHSATRRRPTGAEQLPHNDGGDRGSS
ncbi:branched-chain amino acid ABC transporter permease [Rhodococcus sp. C26F]